jgi:hypothetical protein
MYTFARGSRVQVLNDDLRETFCQRFPGMNREERKSIKATAKMSSPRFVPLCHSFKVSDIESVLRAKIAASSNITWVQM